VIVYLSGPMSGLEDFNYPAFHDAAKRWRAKGWSVISPADNFGGDVALPKEHYMRMDIAQVLQADAIVMLDGWRMSQGAQLEHDIASAIGLEIFFDDK